MVAKPLNRPVVLVDDVVTTGATLLEGRRALMQAGVEVIGFVTIAETLAKS
jgi:predicted amidophosphoribosyltransferase